jgi:signal transduction histidine kinase
VTSTSLPVKAMSTQEDNPKRKLPYRQRLFQRGIVLMAVEFAIGLLILGVLNQLWLTDEKIASDERRQNEVVQQLNKVLARWGYASATLIAAALEGDSDIEQKARFPTNELLKELAKFADLCRSEPEGEDDSETLKKLFRQEAKTLASLSASGTQGVGTILNMNSFEKYYRAIALVVKDRAEVIELVNRRALALELAHQMQDHLNDLMKKIAYAGAAGSLLLAVALASIFAKSISNPLRTIIAKAGQFHLNQRLSGSVQGDDEIAYLDKMVCEASEKLEESDNHRRSIVGMVAHDVRSPLSAAEINLELMQESYGNLPDEAKQLLISASQSINGVVEFVREFLSGQKVAEQAGKEKPDAAQNPSSGQSRSKDQAAPTGRILHGALWLMIGPLIAQFVFFVLINWQLAKAEQIATEQRRLTKINTSLSLIQLNMAKGGALQAMYLVSSTLKLHRDAVACFENVRQELSNTQAAAAGDPAWVESIALANLAFSSQIDRLVGMSPSDPPTKIFSEFARVSELKYEHRSPMSVEARRRTSEVGEQEAEWLKDVEFSQRRASHLLSQIFGWSIVANTLIALGFVITFSTGTTQRLERLMSNAVKLGDREELTEVVPGTDELAQLDRILHQVSAQLKEAASERSERTRSMAEQIRAPLEKSGSLLMEFGQHFKGSISNAAQDQLSRTQQNIDTVLKLINDLLTVEAVGTGMLVLEKTTCNISHVAEQAIGIVASLAQQKSIRLVNSCNDAFIYVDQSRLAQVLVNYLTNAIKFSPEGAEISVAGEQKESSVVISVIDHGPGIESELQEHLFERFFQAAGTESQQGFGLGLAVCKLIAQCHNGRVGVKSELGKGSDFWIELPT